MSLTTLKIKISPDLDDNNRIRLNQILARDTRVIKRFLGIIEYNYDYLLEENKRRKLVLSPSLINEMTLTSKTRQYVKYDLKSQFPRISHNELAECRDTAIALYKSFLELKANFDVESQRRKDIKNGKTRKKQTLRKDKKVNSFPNPKISRKCVPRDINSRRFKLDLRKRSLKIMDSMDTNPKMIRENRETIRHDYLELPLQLFNYHRSILTDESIDIRTVQIIRRKNQYETHIVLKQRTQKVVKTGKKKAVIGIDLGVKKDAVLAVLTDIGLYEQKTFCIPMSLKENIGKLNTRIRQIQREIDSRKNQRPLRPYDSLMDILKKYRDMRGKLKEEADHQISSKIVNYIVELSVKFDVYVALGDLKYLKDSTRDKCAGLRRVIHPFTYGRMTKFIKYKLKKFVLDKRLKLIKEYYTSSFCWKCNEKGKRPKQWSFKCLNPSCLWQGNADLNGAVNIAKRLIAMLKLYTKCGKGLGMYMWKSRKANGKSKTKGKPWGKTRNSLDAFFENDQPLRPGNPDSVHSSHSEEEQEETPSVI